ncbi:EH domain-containing protein 1-like isoform X2 [Quercus lobata]|uniref:EH domain-containing protein 1-like isoform X2 n=1 Tax=Quercus lobata TaxID=97700 RepID=UPI0012472BB9|nr:EH domain-containing protein 1-like isoform X2 [Quercus lobata]
MEIASIPITTCSKEHQQIYQEWFNYADADTDGRITSNDATKFFAMSNLSRQDLKQVWAITDSKRQGYLGFKEFIAAMQLVSLAQAGHAVTHDLLNSDVDLSSLKPPVMEGLDALIAKKKRKEKTSELESNVMQVVCMGHHLQLIGFHQNQQKICQTQCMTILTMAFGSEIAIVFVA